MTAHTSYYCNQYPGQYCIDDEQTLSIWEASHKPVIGPTKKLSKFDTIHEDIRGGYDDMRQLSHGRFQDKGSICYEALIQKPLQTAQIIRIVNDEEKKDTCEWTRELQREQHKATDRDDRSVLYFSEVDRIATDRPLFISFEKRVIGCQLTDVIDGCTLPYGAQRLGLMANLFTQMCHGFAFLHERGFVHSDISPDNVMVEDGRVRIKIIDFDSVVNLNDESNPNRIVDSEGVVRHDWYNLGLYHKDTYRAIECWKAYELVSGSPTTKIFLDLKAVDTCALIMLFWEMLIGVPPPVEQFAGAKELADNVYQAKENGGEDHLQEEFEMAFTFYLEHLLEEMENKYPDHHEHVEELLNDIADFKEQLTDGGFSIEVDRITVDGILKLDWLRATRTI